MNIFLRNLCTREKLWVKKVFPHLAKEQEGVKLISFLLFCIVWLSERISLKVCSLFSFRLLFSKNNFWMSASRFTQSERHAGYWWLGAISLARKTNVLCDVVASTNWQPRRQNFQFQWKQVVHRSLELDRCCVFVSKFSSKLLMEWFLILPKTSRGRFVFALVGVLK